MNAGNHPEPRAYQINQANADAAAAMIIHTVAYRRGKKPKSTVVYQYYPSSIPAKKPDTFRLARSGPALKTASSSAINAHAPSLERNWPVCASSKLFKLPSCGMVSSHFAKSPSTSPNKNTPAVRNS